MIRAKVIGPIVALVLVAGCAMPNNTPIDGKPAHHTENGFRNIIVEDPQRNIFDFWKMKFFGETKWVDPQLEADDVPRQPVNVSALHAPVDGLQATWLGHASFLLQMGGLNILTDPVFSERASPFSFAGPKRQVPHMMDYNALPEIDFVFISHNHYDHLDEATIKKLGNGPVYLVPLGLKEWFIDQGIEPDRVHELDWWQAGVFPNLEVQALPTQHWSARSMFDRRKTLWVSWAIKAGGFNVWFGGDTGYNDVQFKEIGRKTGPYNLALIPIGAYEPRSFMKTYHANPAEAVEIHKDIGSKRSIGIHWGTFAMTAESMLDPMRDLAAAREQAGLPVEEFATLALGETITISN